MAAVKIAHIDFETYSVCDLPVNGLDNYASHKTTGAHCLGNVFDDEAVQLINMHTDKVTPDHPLLRHVASGGVVVAHNAAFELAIWNKVCVPRYGWPELKVEQTRCTMAMAYAMALPGKLELAAKAVGISKQKDIKGAGVMRKLATPKADGSLWKYSDDPELFERLFAYCRQDVEVERELDSRINHLSFYEQRVWELDQLINQRGVQIDLDSVAQAIKLVEQETSRLNSEMLAITGGVVGKCSEVQLLCKWIRSQGVDIGGLSKRSVIDALDGALPARVRQALALRKEAAKTSTAKLIAMRERASKDGRVRGSLQYHGASTGRWAGRGLNVQNLPRPRPGVKQSDIETIFNKLHDAPFIDNFYGPVMDALADCIRGMIVARPGYELVAMDFSAVEARMLAWLSGEDKVLDIFRTHGKIYEHAAAGIYNCPIEEVTKDQRQIGKVAVLALGYQGGVGAFQAMAKGYGVKVGDEKADQIKVAWRKAHPKIVRYWYDLDDAALNAVDQPGKVFAVGPTGRAVAFKVVGSFLVCQLPSKRKIYYPYPTVRDVETPWGETRRSVHFYTTVGTSWILTNGYGGLWAENVTQAASACLLRGAIMRLEEAGYGVVFHAHDEVVVEVPETAPLSTEKEIEELMAVVPEWATDLPLAAEGWRGRRYRK